MYLYPAWLQLRLANAKISIKKRKGKGLWEIKVIFFAPLYKSTVLILIYWLWLCEPAKMLFGQSTDSISKEMVLFGI
jgi:hypothetical protein